jgi:hypothetical protein
MSLASENERKTAMGRAFERSLAMVGAALGFGSGTIEELRGLLTKPTTAAETASWEELLKALGTVGNIDLWNKSVQNPVVYRLSNAHAKVVAEAMWQSPAMYAARLPSSAGPATQRARLILLSHERDRVAALETAAALEPARSPGQVRRILESLSKHNKGHSAFYCPLLSLAYQRRYNNLYSPSETDRAMKFWSTVFRWWERWVAALAPAMPRDFRKLHDREHTELILGQSGPSAIHPPGNVQKSLLELGHIGNFDVLTLVEASIAAVGAGQVDNDPFGAYGAPSNAGAHEDATEQGSPEEDLADLDPDKPESFSPTPPPVAALRKTPEPPPRVAAVLVRPADAAQVEPWRHVLEYLRIWDMTAEERGRAVMRDVGEVTARLTRLLADGTRPTRKMAARFLVALGAPGEGPGAPGAYCGRTNKDLYKGGCRFDKQACKDDANKCGAVDRAWCHSTGAACRAKYAPLLKGEDVTPRRSCSLKPVPTKGRFTCHLDKSGDTRFEDAGYCTYKMGKKRASCTTVKLAQPLGLDGVLRAYETMPTAVAVAAPSGRAKKPLEEVIQAARGSKGHSDAVYLEQYAQGAARLRAARLLSAVRMIAADDGTPNTRKAALDEVRTEFTSKRDAFSAEDKLALSKEIGEAALSLRGLARQAGYASKRAAAAERKRNAAAGLAEDRAARVATNLDAMHAVLNSGTGLPKKTKHNHGQWAG